MVVRWCQDGVHTTGLRSEIRVSVNDNLDYMLYFVDIVYCYV